MCVCVVGVGPVYGSLCVRVLGAGSGAAAAAAVMCVWCTRDLLCKACTTGTSLRVLTQTQGVGVGVEGLRAVADVEAGDCGACEVRGLGLSVRARPGAFERAKYQGDCVDSTCGLWLRRVWT